MLQHLSEQPKFDVEKVKNRLKKEVKNSCNESVPNKEIWYERVRMSSMWQPPCSCGIYIADLF